VGLRRLARSTAPALIATLCALGGGVGSVRPARLAGGSVTAGPCVIVFLAADVPKPRGALEPCEVRAGVRYRSAPLSWLLALPASACRTRWCPVKSDGSVSRDTALAGRRGRRRCTGSVADLRVGCTRGVDDPKPTGPFSEYRFGGGAGALEGCFGRGGKTRALGRGGSGVAAMCAYWSFSGALTADDPKPLLVFFGVVRACTASLARSRYRSGSRVGSVRRAKTEGFLRPSAFRALLSGLRRLSEPGSGATSPNKSFRPPVLNGGGLGCGGAAFLRLRSCSGRRYRDISSAHGRAYGRLW